MKKDPIIFIDHIIENIRLIEDSSKDLSKEEIEENQIIKDAILRELEVIGEAVKNLPESFKSKYPKVQWKQIAGLRDKLIHHYFGVDLNLVWGVIKDDIPKLKRDLLEIKKKL